MDYNTYSETEINGNFKMIKWLIENGCPTFHTEESLKHHIAEYFNDEFPPDLEKYADLIEKFF
jgi:hypothetical protein